MDLETAGCSKVLSWHATIGLQETSTVWEIIVLGKRRVTQLVIKFGRLRDEIYSEDSVLRQLNTAYTPFLKDTCLYYFLIYA
jgi:hypothetical protein